MSAARVVMAGVCLLLVCVVGPARAQSSIVGTVEDASGGVLPGVTVEASSEALIEGSKTTVTDGTGRFRIIDLRPGTYTVTFTLTGFQTLKRSDIALPGEFTATVNAQLTVGQLAETILVSANVTTVDTQNAVRITRLDRDALDRKKPFVLFEQNAERTYVAQSGLIGQDLPNHRTRFSSPAERFVLEPGQKYVEVPLTAAVGHGIEVTKIYRFERGSYLIDVSFEIANHGAAPIQPYAYFQFVRDDKPPEGNSAMVPTFTVVKSGFVNMGADRNASPPARTRKPATPRNRTSIWSSGSSSLASGAASGSGDVASSSVAASSAGAESSSPPPARE